MTIKKPVNPEHHRVQQKFAESGEKLMPAGSVLPIALGPALRPGFDEGLTPGQTSEGFRRYSLSLANLL